MSVDPEKIDELIKATNRLNRATGSNTNSVVTTFNAGGLVGAAGVVALALAAMWAYVSAKDRDADMRVMTAEQRANMKILEHVQAELEQHAAQLRADRLLIARTEQRLTRQGIPP